MRTLRYVLCDVFTDRALAGNALAVFTDARALDDETMQALARETNLSETTFVLPRTREDADVRMRIFTPAREVPFAGHPTLGTALVLGAGFQKHRLRIETGVGVIPVDLEREGARISFARMEQPVPTVQPFADTPALLAALGVREPTLPVEVYDNGIRHAFVTVSSREEVAAVRPDLGRLPHTCVSVCSGEGTRWKTRMFAPWAGVPEDPATGSAAGPLAVHLARHGRVPFGQEITIEQGAELRRPSLLYATAEGRPERITRVTVGGSGVIVARGQFTVP